MTKTLSLLKNYWYVPVAIVLLIVFLVSRQTKTAEKIINLMRRSAEKQKQEFSKIDKLSQQKKENQTKLYNEAIEALEKKHETNKEKLDEKTKKKVEKLVKNNTNTELAEKLAKSFGIEIG